MELSDFPRAESLLARALAASRDARVPTDVRARVLIAMAEIEDENGTYAKAMAHAQEGLGLLRIPAPGSLEAIATAHQVITHGLIGLGNTAVAETEAALRLCGSRRRRARRPQRSGRRPVGAIGPGAGRSRALR